MIDRELGDTLTEYNGSVCIRCHFGVDDPFLPDEFTYCPGCGRMIVRPKPKKRFYNDLYSDPDCDRSDLYYDFIRGIVRRKDGL